MLNSQIIKYVSKVCRKTQKLRLLIKTIIIEEKLKFFIKNYRFQKGRPQSVALFYRLLYQIFVPIKGYC
ncbi:hypothetical protein TPHV1_110031 [Treponema phagedenis]|uniref:Uncharacterized protein n=1 Tax=Treponema phagedenis TaxID=162 RepID=A0A0B7GV10_TREPH|nr:hypothetical protein TPHV1_110031 [Treponema phagedenis]